MSGRIDCGACVCSPEQPGCVVVPHQHAVLVSKTVEQLQAERAELLAQLGGCTDGHCPHHYLQIEQLDSVRWLLGES